MTDAQQSAHASLAVLVGQMAFAVERGFGTFLTLDFGAPHLFIREPKRPKRPTPKRVARILKRRHVSVTGDWHLWIEHADWTLTTANGALNQDDDIGTPKDECLTDLQGQRLRTIEFAAETQRWTLAFDFGGVLVLSPVTGYEIDDDAAIWSLSTWDRDIASLRMSGVFSRTLKSPRQTMVSAGASADTAIDMTRSATE